MFQFENNIIKTECVPLGEESRGGLGYLCFNFMKENAEKIAQINISTNEEETYKELLQKCIRTGIALQKLGISKGDVVAFCSETNLNSCVPLVACFLIGAVPIYIDMSLPLLEVTHFVNRANPKVFLVTSNFTETIQNLIKEQNRNTDVVTFTESFFHSAGDEEKFAPVYIDDLQETGLIVFSSGSTGLPKGICINHYSLLGTKILTTDDHWIPNEQKVLLSFDTFHWSIETLRFVHSIKEGACRLICSNESDVKKAWHFLEKYKVNVTYLFPFTILSMLETGKPKDIDLRNLRTIFIEGSSLPDKYLRDIQLLLPDVDVLTMYGQTEASLLTIFSKNDLHREYIRSKPGCVGLPHTGQGTYLKVVDLESGEILGPNKPGELRVKGRAVMNGYHNLDSSDQFDEDGWLKTGDVAYYDEDFCFFIVGRVKELILFQRWHIAPAIIEAELMTHPAVKLAVVIGVPHSSDTEHPLGLVVLHNKLDKVTPTEIEKYIEERVPNKYRLRGGVKIIEESCLGTANKIRRVKLKELVLSGKI